MTGGFAPIRRGILEHVHRGDLTSHELAAYLVLILEADWETGIWWGSARKLAASFGAGDLTERLARRVLERLEERGYIKRFPTPGSHGNYAVLIEKFECTDGARKGMRLNATKSNDWHNPVYESRRGDGQGEGEEMVKDVTSIQEEEVIRNTKSKPAVSPSPAAQGLVGETETSSKNGQPSAKDLLPIARAVYEHYLAAFAKQPALYRFTPPRQAMLKARARDAFRTAREMQPEAGQAEWLRMTREAMCRCVDALKRSPFHAGQNDRGRKYQDLAHVFRSTEKFEEWLER